MARVLGQGGRVGITDITADPNRCARLATGQPRWLQRDAPDRVGAGDRLHALRHFHPGCKVTRATVSPPSHGTSTVVLSGVRISSGVSNEFCSPRP
jgi:hypothetical protein